jgi:hypothetical protein
MIPEAAIPGVAIPGVAISEALISRGIRLGGMIPEEMILGTTGTISMLGMA